MSFNRLLAAALLTASTMVPVAAQGVPQFRSPLSSSIVFSVEPQTEAPSLSEIGRLETIVDVPFSFRPSVDGGKVSEWSMGSAFDAASGLSLRADGEIHGTPLQAGLTGPYVIKAINDVGEDEATFDVMTYARLTAQVDGERLEATLDQALDLDLRIAGGKTPIQGTWLTPETERPPGVTIAGGRLSGTPTEIGSWEGLQVAFEDGLEQTVVRAFDLAVARAASIMGWGQDGYGTFGRSGSQGQDVYTHSPIPLDHLEGMTRITAEWSHGCGFKGGTLYCWGNNAQGQLGNGTQAATNGIVAVGSDFIDAKAGGEFTCGIKSDGLYCWGRNDSGQLGLGVGTSEIRTSPTKILGSESFVGLEISGRSACARTQENKYSCWGYNANGTFPSYTTTIASPTAMPYLDGFTQIALGTYHGCGIKGEDAYCWSRNNMDGQISGTPGSGSIYPRLVGNGYTWIDAGATTSCGRKSGTYMCWGNNDYGQFGSAPQRDRYGVERTGTPRPIYELSGFSNVQMGAYAACGMKSGDLYCWGNDGEGQMGNGPSVVNVNLPAKVPHAKGFSNFYMGRGSVFGVVKQ